MPAPRKITTALSITNFASIEANGHLHSLHFHWDKLDHSARLWALAKAEREIGRALAAISEAKEELLASSAQEAA